MIKQRLLFIILGFFLVVSHCQDSLALSKYGLRCENNKKCLECRADLTCIKCMHACLNIYGDADTDKKNHNRGTSQENCQLQRAKWCNAQCWDPDDEKKPGYVITKPSCSSKNFYSSGSTTKPLKTGPLF